MHTYIAIRISYMNFCWGNFTKCPDNSTKPTLDGGRMVTCSEEESE